MGHLFNHGPAQRQESVVKQGLGGKNARIDQPSFKKGGACCKAGAWGQKTFALINPYSRRAERVVKQGGGEKNIRIDQPSSKKGRK